MNRISELEAALRKIAYEPFGHAEASHAEVLQLITDYARDVLAAPEDRLTGPGQDILW